MRHDSVALARLTILGILAVLQDHLPGVWVRLARRLSTALHAAILNASQVLTRAELKGKVPLARLVPEQIYRFLALSLHDVSRSAPRGLCHSMVGAIYLVMPRALDMQVLGRAIEVHSAVLGVGCGLVVSPLLLLLF